MSRTVVVLRMLSCQSMLRLWLCTMRAARDGTPRLSQDVWSASARRKVTGEFGWLNGRALAAGETVLESLPLPRVGGHILLRGALDTTKSTLVRRRYGGDLDRTAAAPTTTCG